MTATTTGVVPVAKRAGVGWGDLAWLTWRQHRWAIAGLVAGAAAVVALALVLVWRVDATGDMQGLFGRWRFISLGSVVMLAPIATGLAIAVFWAAPVLAREYEQRTHLVVWSQDITPTRWLTGKVVLLGVPAVAVAVGVGLASRALVDSINATSDRPVFELFAMPAFEAVPLVQTAYAAFGFALGLAFSAVTRRTVLSMGLTLGAFIGVRVVVAGLWRPNFQTPLSKVEPYDAYRQQWDGPGDGSWVVNSGFSDAAGNEVDYPACSNTVDQAAYAKCMNDNNVLFFTQYHPADRLVPFQLFESAIFLVLAAGLLALAFARVRRARRI